MKARHLLFALAALCAGVGPALAQPNDPPNMVPGNEAYNREHPWEVPGRPYDHNEWARAAALANSAQVGVGQHLPQLLRNSQYAVDNWWRHRLARPPAGYRWYRVGDDFVLVDRAGVIAQAQSRR